MIKFDTKNIFQPTGTASILLNFAPDGKHGCYNKCSFCHWKDWKDLKHMVYSNEDLIEFCKYNRHCKVSLAGGGDPLWEFETNYPELRRMIDCLRNDCDKNVEIITTNIRTAVENYENGKLSDCSFCFSIETISDEIIKLLSKIPKEKIRISVLYDPVGSSKKDSEYLDRYIRTYSEYVGTICIRMDYFNNTPHSEYLEMRHKFARYPQVVFMEKCCYQLSLLGDRICTTADIDELIK